MPNFLRYFEGPGGPVS